MGQVYYGSGLCEILKNVKVGKNAKSERGKCPQYGFERVLNFEEVDPKSFCMGGSNEPPTLLPITILGPLRKCTVGGGKCEKCKVRKG